MDKQYKNWARIRPTYEDFGLSQEQIPMIEEARVQYNNLSFFAPSSELSQLKKSFEKKKYRDFGNVTLVASFVIVILIVTAFMTRGFREFSWEKVGYAYIITIAVGIIAVGIVMNLLDRFILEPIQNRINRDYDETSKAIRELQEREQADYLKSVNAKYKSYYSMVGSLDEYYKALDFHERCQSKQHYEYWDSKQGGNGNDFEEACAEYLSDRGFDARVTKIGPDGGIDIEAKRGTMRFACQCKALGTKVSSGDMQKFVGALVMGPYDRGIFFSLNGFSDNAKKIAKNSPKRIYYMDKNDLVSGEFFSGQYRQT